MQRIIKGIKFLVFVILCNICITNVNAAGATISVSSSSKQVVVGNTVKVYVTVSSSAPLGSWEFDIDYDKNVLSFVSSDLEGSTRSVGVVNSSKVKSKKYTLKFKAKNSGTAKIGIKNADVVGYDEKGMSVSTGSTSIKTITQKELESSYSSDNYLSSLEVEGYSISPKFDKKTTKYSLTVPNDVKSIKVKARESDSKASVSGDGTRKLNEGNNKLNVVVTAENGNKKTYTINVTVKELNPINVTIDGKEYTVVRKKDLLESPSTYTDTTVTISGEQVPALESSITNYTLVGLSNSDGDINLYIYDNDKYTLYKEHKFNGVTIYPKTPKKEDMLEGVEEKELEINDKKIVGYTIKGLSYDLVYGVNVETGKEGWYTYESSENTLQKYVESGSDSKEKGPVKVVQKEEFDDKYKTLSIILGGVSGILFIFLIIAAVKISMKKKAEI